MKKYFTKSLWLIIAALLVVSCSKEDGVMDSSRGHKTKRIFKREAENDGRT